MRRRAYIEHKGLSIGINTVFIAQKDFSLDKLGRYDAIDLVSLKVVSSSRLPSFYLRPVSSWESMDHYEDPDGTVFEIGGTVDSYGRQEVFGYIGRGESKDFSCYVA